MREFFLAAMRIFVLISNIPLIAIIYAGYGPFLIIIEQKDGNGASVFPDTFGGGIGVERALFALTKGECVKKVDDVTFFGKNPDSHPIFLY